MHLKQGATPVFAKARDIPYALRDVYAKEINKKLVTGQYTHVDHSEWASITIVIDEHLIPKQEDKVNKMHGAKIFCLLDITDAYTYLSVDEEFSQALTVNTPTHGLVRPTRAVYSAANIPAIWQRRLESVIKDIPHVLNFFDDLIIFCADSFDDLMQTLGTVINVLYKNGLRLNQQKCTFAAPSIEFIGHRLDASEIHQSDKHIQAILRASKPSSAQELELFIGKATFYNAFIPDLATKARPVCDMLLKESFHTAFGTGDRCKQEFKPTKAYANADYCSRIPGSSLKEEEIPSIDEFNQFVIHQIAQLPVKAKTIAKEIKKDQNLGRIVQLLSGGQDLNHHRY
ncbi:uncharacterized protein K02A2.6-like [Copidosoma floridanum]|uniref:uncharacterized protein K02A2.6-like n=1 Tax=Copidosoma floridanum TaxID=29053 RepID=UPI000C6F9FDD|nr:uncharacterized protein K02A2.6-like [Copidosoma floridanum]